MLAAEMATTRTSPEPASGGAHFSATGLSGHFIVCGLDELGFRCAEELNRLQEMVVVVSPTVQGQFQGRVHAMGLHTVHANYREDEGLRRAGIMGARAIIIAGTDDVGNIHAALAIEHPELAMPLVNRFEEIWATGEPGVAGTVLGL